MSKYIKYKFYKINLVIALKKRHKIFLIALRINSVELNKQTDKYTHKQTHTLLYIYIDYSKRNSAIMWVIQKYYKYLILKSNKLNTKICKCSQEATNEVYI